MTVLYAIYGDDGVTAVELYCGDDVKYCEHFNSWQHLMHDCGNYMSDYASVRVVTIDMWNRFYNPANLLIELKGVN
jgi:hypothetical protein